MKRIISLFLILSGLCFPPFVFQAEAGRPLNTDDAGTVAPGVLEIETAYQYVDLMDDEHTSSLVLTTGLLKSLDIGVEVPYLYIDVDGGNDQDGLSDIGITSKWNFYTDEDNFETALSFNYKIG